MALACNSTVCLQCIIIIKTDRLLSGSEFQYNIAHTSQDSANFLCKMQQTTVDVKFIQKEIYRTTFFLVMIMNFCLKVFNIKISFFLTGLTGQISCQVQKHQFTKQLCIARLLAFPNPQFGYPLIYMESTVQYSNPSIIQGTNEPVDNSTCGHFNWWTTEMEDN